jgi:hypothetical protein
MGITSRPSCIGLWSVVLALLLALVPVTAAGEDSLCLAASAVRMRCLQELGWVLAAMYGSTPAGARTMPTGVQNILRNWSRSRRTSLGQRHPGRNGVANRAEGRCVRRRAKDRGQATAAPSIRHRERPRGPGDSVQQLSLRQMLARRIRRCLRDFSCNREAKPGSG